MDCRNLAKTLAQAATWLAYFVAFFIAVFSVARADTPSSKATVRIMRGDLYFETGKPDLARNVYQIVERSSSPAAADAKARLSALDHGGVATSDIKALRDPAGAQCTMCHSR